MSRSTILIFITLIGGASALGEGLADALSAQQRVYSGREAFLKRCAGCHGNEADGNGPAAPMLDPRPRNLVMGSFKFKSTPEGVLPTTADLLRTIDQGVPGTSMPSFRDVSEPEKLALVAYIRSLRPEFAETRYEQTSASFPAPPAEIFSKKAGLLESAARGKMLFAKNCQNCHGETGRGDGPSTEGMTDSEDQPIRPADLGRKTIKSGATVRDVFKAITIGLEGAPMPSYLKALSETERWDLVAYVFYLRGIRAGIYTEKDALQ